MDESAAEVLATCLQAIERGELTPEECLARYPDHRAELAPLLELARQLRAVPAAPARLVFQHTARRRMLNRLPARAPRTLWERLLPARPAWAGQRLLVAALIVMALVILFGSGATVSASGRALPGDRLYPLKTTVEDVRLTLSGDEDEVELYLEFNRARLAEIVRLVDTGRYEDVSTAADRYKAHARDATLALDRLTARDVAAAAALAERLEECRCANDASLRELLDTVPEQARPFIERALEDDEDEAEHEDRDEAVKGQPHEDIKEGVNGPGHVEAGDDEPEGDADRPDKIESDDAGREGGQDDTPHLETEREATPDPDQHPEPGDGPTGETLDDGPDTDRDHDPGEPSPEELDKGSSGGEDKGSEDRYSEDEGSQYEDRDPETDNHREESGASDRADSDDEDNPRFERDSRSEQSPRETRGALDDDQRDRHD